MEKENRMAEMPVKRLMLSMGIPIIISMVLQAVYNIVDSAFVSNMTTGGEQALNALTLAFPMQILMVAVGIGTGVGANVLTAKSLGSGNTEQANRTAGNAAFMSGLIYLVFLIFGIFGTEIYIGSQTDDPAAAAMGTDYLRICCVFSFGMSFFAIYEKLLQATGHSVYSTIAQIAGAVTNIVLDPVMIYGWLGCPEMGVRGAAYATVIGQVVSFVLAFVFHLKVNTDITNNIRYLKPDLRIIGQMYSVGFPAIIAQALISVMTYGMNLILGDLGNEAQTAYGLYYKVMQFLLFAAFGMRDAIMPITAFSYGMGSAGRIKESVKFGHIYTFVIMIAGTLLLEMLAEPFTAVFGLSGVTSELCVSAMRIISLCFVFAGVNIAFQGVFQALGAGVESLIISICRQLLFVFPFAWLFAGMAGEQVSNAWIVWFTFPIAEFLTAAAAVFLYIRIYNRKLRQLETAAVSGRTAEI